VANIGDMIEGNLRVTARVTSEEDVIQQVMTASELISYFLNALYDFGLDVKYISVLDNHSRANVNFREHIEKESFAKLIDWYVQGRLKEKVEFIANSIDENIGYLEIDGKTHWFVHGHLKAHSVNTIVQNLTVILGIKPDFIHLGHWHSSQTKEFCFTKVFVNGSLTGVDDFAFNMGYFSKPSQSLVVIDGDNDIRIDINL
jgi:predicted phosphodiesterase